MRQTVRKFLTSLTSSPWFMLSANTAAANGIGPMQDLAATSPQRFYLFSAPYLK